MKNIPDISSLVHLVKLDLHDNNISEISGSDFDSVIDNGDVLLHLSILEDLNLSKNNIKDIPTFICKLKELKKLNLGYNHINKLPQEIFGICRTINF